MSKKITLKDVASAAGVSHQLVSAVLSGRESTIRYSQATKAKVEAAAKRLGFNHCILAQSFKANRSFLVGVMIPRFQNHVQDDTLTGLQDVLVPHGLTPLFLSYQTADEEEDALQIFQQRQVDAVVVSPQNPSLPAYAQLAEKKTPMVEIFNRLMAPVGVPSVLRNMEQNGYEGTRHLLGLGHRRIALVTHDRYRDPRHWDAGHHHQGYARAMQEAGFKPKVIAHSIERFVLGRASTFYQCTEEIVDQALAPGHPTALICYTSMEAFALLAAAKSRGIHVPRELSVVSTDQFPEISNLFSPQLTTMGAPVAKLGRMAAELVLAQLRGEPVAKKTLIPPELFPGGSTAVAPK